MILQEIRSKAFVNAGYYVQTFPVKKRDFEDIQTIVNKDWDLLRGKVGL